jgi:hypothetical protein
MNKACIFLIAVLVSWNIFLIGVKAEEVLFLMFTIYKNDTLSINDLKVTDAPSLLPKDEGDYKIEITNNKDETIFSSRMEVQFLILSDPPIETNESLIMLKMPWNENMEKIKFYHSDNLIHLIELCNKNGQCEHEIGENSINCPQDCPIATTTTTTIPVKKPSTSIFIYLIIIVIIIAVIAVFFLRKIKVVR